MWISEGSTDQSEGCIKQMIWERSWRYEMRATSKTGSVRGGSNQTDGSRSP